MTGKKKLERRLSSVPFIPISKEKPETSVAATEPWAQQTHHSHHSLICARYDFTQQRGAQAPNTDSAGSNCRQRTGVQITLLSGIKAAAQHPPA